MSGLIKWIGTQFIRSGFLFPEEKVERLSELIHLKELLKMLEINCVLDVGANHGQYVEDLRAVGYTRKIISFEPVEKEFMKMFDKFSSDPHWEGHQIALGSEEKIMTIHLYKESVLNSFLDSVDANKGTVTQQVPMKRLDDIFSSLLGGIESPRVFLKMDTQGFDLEVFKGSSRCLETGLIVGLQSEISIQPMYKDMPHYLETLQLYETAGFELFNLSAVTRGDDDNELIEMNCFMRRK